MVYYNAKKLILPAYSFPARAVVNMMESIYNYNVDDNIITNTDLQYLTHKELVSIINRYIYCKKIKNATAISLRSDGSVDRTHVYKIYTFAKLIDKVGNESLIFIGVGEPLERGVSEVTMIKSMENLLGSNVTNLIMKEVLSVVTDSTSLNIGQHYGLWKTFKD